MKKIAIIVGSLRKQSFNRSVAKYLASMAPEGYAISFPDIGRLALYNQDLDDTPTENWVQFRDEVKAVDALLFVTPEYNRSIPGVLKNAIDVGSRPYGQSVWSGKPGGIVSVSPGDIGGFGANHHLRQVLSCLNVYLMNHPEAYVGNIMEALDSSGQIIAEKTPTFLTKYMNSFIRWIGRF
ncbi:MAG: NAD(P)H-dependent oxidoreductase [Desulfobacterales bacterium]|nr:NAD(P)H-dependent oxidoreductase [Desulfobacterales bacterium]